MRVRITDGYREKQVLFYSTETPNEEAKFAFELLGRFGLIAAGLAGEDSAGRARLDLLPVHETVERCFDLAAEAFRLARARGLMVEIPDLNEVNATEDPKD